MSQTKIKCPNCGFDFNADEVLFHQAEEKARKIYETKLSEQLSSVNKRKEDVEAEYLKVRKLKEEQDDIIRRKLLDEKKRLEEETYFKAKKEVEFDMLKLKQDYEIKMKENNQLKKKEVEILNKERELREKRDQLEIDVEKKLLDREKEIQQKAAAKENEKFLLQKKEFEKQIEEQKKVNLEQKLREKELRERESELIAKNDQDKREIEKGFEEKILQIENTIALREKEKNEKIRIEYIKQFDDQRKLIEELKNREVEMLRREHELKEAAEHSEIESKKKFLEQQKALEDKIVKREEEKFELKIREREKMLEDQKRLIEEMKRKSEQGSSNLQGEVQEIAIEEFLKINFPFDKIIDVKKGERGADALHLVINNLQQECGKIIYESKRTQAFSERWIDKLKDDQKFAGAEIAVIVTEAMPRDMDRFGLRNGVWVCTFNEIKAFAFVLREMLLMTHSVRSVQENKGDKKEMIYNYLTSNEFRQQVEAIVEGFTAMQNDLLKEKVAMEKIWSTREKQIRKVLTNTSSMYGSIQGLAGNSMESIRALELPETNGE